MKMLLVLFAIGFSFSIVACNKKSEKCVYNGQEMPCDEFRKMHEPKPQPTEQQAESPSDSQNDPTAQCTEAATNIVKDEKVLTLCPNANPETSSCMIEAWVAHLSSDDIIKVCENATTETDECIAEGYKSKQSSEAIVLTCSNH